jgi:uncharacterized protein involved in exopolysaccharide biosynthesis
VRSALRRNALVIPLAVVAALLGTGVWIVVRPVRYRATATIRVRPAGNDYVSDPILAGVIVGSGQPLETASGVIASEGAAGPTARELGGGVTAAQVGADVSVQPGRRAAILDVEARASEPRLAVRIANEFALVALKLDQQALMRQAVRVLADVPRYFPAEIAALRSVIKGADPTFALQSLASRASSTAESAWALLGLALIPGLALGLAGALLAGLLAQRSPATPGSEAGVAPSPALIGNKPS